MKRLFFRTLRRAFARYDFPWYAMGILVTLYVVCLRPHVIFRFFDLLDYMGEKVEDDMQEYREGRGKRYL